MPHQKIPPPHHDLPPTEQPCRWFWPAPPFPSTPQRASCSDKFSPGNNSCRRVPPSLWSWLLGCEALCPPESEMLSSSADSTNKEPGSRGMVLSPQDQLGCKDCWPKRCDFSNYYCYFSFLAALQTSYEFMNPSHTLFSNYLFFREKKIPK